MVKQARSDRDTTTSERQEQVSAPTRCNQKRTTEEGRINVKGESGQTEVRVYLLYQRRSRAALGTNVL